jgi:hypothetical protein
MPKIELDIETNLEPERVKDALLDFSPRRPDLWPGIDRGLYEVYSVGETSAEVKEGTRMPGMMIWAKERYDWSTPGLIKWTVQESNFSAPGSYVSAAIAPKPGGGSRVHVTWDRQPSSFMGRILMAMMKASNGRPIRLSMQKAFQKMEKASA